MFIPGEHQPHPRVSKTLQTIRQAGTKGLAAVRRFLPFRVKRCHYLLMAGLFLLITAGFNVWFWTGLLPVQRNSEETVLVTVPVGSGLSGIAYRLERAGLLRNRRAFVLYVRLRGAEKRLRAGDYRMNRTMSAKTILAKLSRGERAEFTVTFPEGLTIGEVARILGERGLVNVDEFVGLVSSEAFASSYYSDLTSSRSPEGFLFPDTYRIAEGTAPGDIVSMLLKRFRQVYSADLAQEATRRRMSVKDVITLASIVEKEARHPEERSVIAAVFHNRLKKGLPLQSCATVQYALGVRKSKLSYADLEVDSPYNTYRHKGLPPGPIANPGLDSIRAALYPANVKYLYFVARDDGTHIFSHTYNEHLRAQRGLKNNR